MAPLSKGKLPLICKIVFEWQQFKHALDIFAPEIPVVPIGLFMTGILYPHAREIMFIAGLRMGGNGVFKVAMARPERVISAACLS